MEICIGRIHFGQYLSYSAPLRWRVSKLIFARAQNDPFKYGKLQSQTVANDHRNIDRVHHKRSQPSEFRSLISATGDRKASNRVEQVAPVPA